MANQRDWPLLRSNCPLCGHPNCPDCREVSVSILACCKCRARAIKRLEDLQASRQKRWRQIATSLIRSRDIKEARRRLPKSEASSGASSVLVALNDAPSSLESAPIIPKDFLGPTKQACPPRL